MDLLGVAEEGGQDGRRLWPLDTLAQVRHPLHISEKGRGGGGGGGGGGGDEEEI